MTSINLSGRTSQQQVDQALNDSVIRYDEPQSLLAAQQTQALTNIGAAPLSSIIKRYLTDIPGVTTGINGNAAINGFLINAALPGLFYLRPDEFIPSTQIFLPSGSAIIYDGPVTRRPRFYMPASVYNNTVPLIPASAANGSGALFKAWGSTTSALSPVDRVQLEGFIIESEVADGRALNAIAFRNVTNFQLNGLEIFGLPLGFALALDSVRGGLIDSLYVHDSVTAYGGYGTLSSAINVTAVSFDDNRSSDLGVPVASSRVTIRSATVINMTMTGSALSTYGPQTDGFTFNSGCQDITVTDAHVDQTGEAFDIQGLRIDVKAATIPTAYGAGIKLYHGAKDCAVDAKIGKVGLSHVFIGGSNATGVGDTQGNRIYATCDGFIDPASNYFASSTQACVALSGSSGFTHKAQYNYVQATCDASVNGDYVARDDLMCENNIFDILVVGAGASGICANFSSMTNKFRMRSPSNCTITLTLATQTAPTSSSVQFKPDTVTVDSYSQYSTSTGRYVAKYPHRVRVSARVRNANTWTTGDGASLRIRVNGTEVSGGANQPLVTGQPVINETIVCELNTGDYIDLLLVNGSATNSFVIGANGATTYACIEEL